MSQLRRVRLVEEKNVWLKRQVADRSIDEQGSRRPCEQPSNAHADSAPETHHPPSWAGHEADRAERALKHDHIALVHMLNVARSHQFGLLEDNLAVECAKGYSLE